jgi:hypothetical protein
VKNFTKTKKNSYVPNKEQFCPVQKTKKYGHDSNDCKVIEKKPARKNDNGGLCGCLNQGGA